MLRRRTALGALASLHLGAGHLGAAAVAAEDALAAAIRAEIGDRVPVDGGITLRLPQVVENGGQVPVAVMVDSPMTAEQHVIAIHLFATRNPTPGVASFILTPAMGKAEVQTRIRLAEEQSVIALAELSDGSVRRASAWAEVRQSGCLS